MMNSYINGTYGNIIKKILVVNKFRLVSIKSMKRTQCQCAIFSLHLEREHSNGKHFYLLCPNCYRVELYKVNLDNI